MGRIDGISTMVGRPRAGTWTTGTPTRTSPPLGGGIAKFVSPEMMGTNYGWAALRWDVTNMTPPPPPHPAHYIS